MLCLDVATPLYKAARYALDTRARRVVAVDRRQVCGVLTGLDFQQVVLDGGVALPLGTIRSIRAG